MRVECAAARVWAVCRSVCDSVVCWQADVLLAAMGMLCHGLSVIRDSLAHPHYNSFFINLYLYRDTVVYGLGRYHPATSYIS